jgi:hypothetical protein
MLATVRAASSAAGGSGSSNSASSLSSLLFAAGCEYDSVTQPEASTPSATSQRTLSA